MSRKDAVQLEVISPRHVSMMYTRPEDEMKEKSLPLTSENLKKFEKQFQRADNFNPRRPRRIPQRTAGDGKSEKHSGDSLRRELAVYEALEQERLLAEKPGITLQRRSTQSLIRPERDAFRRNPEGQSQNESIVPLAVSGGYKTTYYDDLDYRIPYEDPNYVINSDTQSSPMGNHAIVYETSSVTSSSVTPIVRKKQVKVKAKSDGSIATSTSASSDDIFDDDDYDDDSSSNGTTTITKQASSMKTGYYSSSISSISSIPTLPSLHENFSSKSTETQSLRKTSVLSHMSEQNQSAKLPELFPILKSSADEISEISAWNDRDTVISASTGRTSQKESSIDVSSRASYITIRNWSRWGRYTGGGYSITDKVLPLKKSPIGSQSSASSRASSRFSSSGSGTSSDNILSVPEFPVRKKDFGPLMLDDDHSSSSEFHLTSRMLNSNLEPRASSEWNLPNIEDKNRTSLNELARSRGIEGNNVNQSASFRYKNQTFPKLRDRPTRQRQAVAEEVQSQRVRYYTRKKTRRGKTSERLSGSDDVDESNLSVNTTSSYAPPLRRKPVSMASRKNSSVSMTTDSSISLSTSRVSASPTLRRKTDALVRFVNFTDSGFATACSPSSGASIRPTETPFTPFSRKRSTSLRSIVSEYSSYPSICGSSLYLSQSSSSLSMSSYSDGSTIQNEEVKPIKQETERVIEQVKSKNDEKGIKLPPVKCIPSHSPKKTSPYYSSLTPAVTARIRVLRKAIRNAKLADEKHKNGKFCNRKVFRVNHPMPSFEEAYRDHGMPRLKKLAMPKESKAVWATSFWPVRWGDQSMVFPLSRTAIKSKGTARLEELAKAKKDFRKDEPDMCARDAFQFSCGRASVILGASPFAMKGKASERIIQLAKHKTTMQEFEDRAQRTNYIFSCGRSSPIWDVRDGAKTADERGRTMSLAHPKKNHPNYHPEKSCIWPVSDAARKAAPRHRTEQLARPKSRSDGLHREPTWDVSSAARRTVASARVQELSKAKQTVEGYEHCRELLEPISKSVLRASSSDRIRSLSKPIIRETMDHVQFNPNAFKVSEAALKGRIPDRIADLAQPFSRFK